MKNQPSLSPGRISQENRLHFSPIRNLTPDTLSRMLDAFHRGELRQAAQAWDAMERRDDVLQGVAAKRKKAVSRLDWEVTCFEESESAEAQRAALVNCYQRLSCGHALDASIRGGLPLLIFQMMDAVGKRYAVHEIVWPRIHNIPTPQLRFVPLWFFESRSGQLRFLKHATAHEGQALEPGGWLITTGDGLMESCSIAWMFKHLPLRDWLIYCERNGMPGVKGTTDAPPGSAEWEAAREAVNDFGAEFHALMSRGTELEAIDLSSRGDLPYPALVERMDRAMAALWRGVDLATMSRSQGVGATIQMDELAMIEADDAARISDSLHAQLDLPLLSHLFPGEPPLARFKLIPRDRSSQIDTLRIFKAAQELGVDIQPEEVRQAIGLRGKTAAP